MINNQTKSTGKCYIEHNRSVKKVEDERSTWKDVPNTEMISYKEFDF